MKNGRSVFSLKHTTEPRPHVSPDGRRLLAIVLDVVANERPLSVVVNWTAEAK